MLNLIQKFNLIISLLLPRRGNMNCECRVEFIGPEIMAKKKGKHFACDRRIIITIAYLFIIFWLKHFSQFHFSKSGIIDEIHSLNNPVPSAHRTAQNYIQAYCRYYQYTTANLPTFQQPLQQSDPHFSDILGSLDNIMEFLM